MKFTENTTRINCMHYFFHKSCWCFVPLGWPSRVFSKGARYSWEAKPILQWQESDFCFSTIDGRTFHLHLHNFDMSVKGREIFSRDNTHGNLLTADHGTFGKTDFTSTCTACTRWVFSDRWYRTSDLRFEVWCHNH